MSNKKRSISDGDVTITAPEEHGGESRYGWVAHEGKVNRMYLRIEKCPGTSAQYDVVSPIVSLAFIREGLLFQIQKPDRVPGYKNQTSDSVLNPYLNATVFQAPWLLMDRSILGKGRWKAGYETHFRGDFLFLEGPKGLRYIINIWGVGLVRGLQKLKFSGDQLSFVFEDEVIGVLPQSRAHAFIQKVRIDENPPVQSIGRIFSKALWSSYEEVLRLLQVGDRDNLYGRPIDMFQSADMNVNGDRTGPRELMLPESLKMAREAFSDLFPI